MTERVFRSYNLNDGDYECHGCSGTSDLVEIVLPNLCNQNLVLCRSCRTKLYETLSLLIFKGVAVLFGEGEQKR